MFRFIKDKVIIPFIVVSLFLVFLATYQHLTATTNLPAQAPLVPIADVVVHKPEDFKLLRYRPQEVTMRGIGAGFMRIEEQDVHPSKRTQIDEFVLAKGETVFDIWGIFFSEKPTTLLVSLIVNYEQVPFELDGEFGLLHEIEITSPDMVWETPLKVDLQKPGAHDVILIAFANPYDTSLDAVYRSEKWPVYSAKRTVVIVGENRTPAGVLPAPLPVRPSPADVHLGFRSIFATTTSDPHSHFADRQLYTAEGIAGETFPFQIWSSNAQGEAGSDYAYMLFQNFHQVPINGQKMVLAYLEPNEEVVINTVTTLAAEPGLNQLEVVTVFDPYRSVLNGEVRASFVFNPFRIAVYTPHLPKIHNR